MKVCPKCENKLVEVESVCATMVGHSSPSGHSHDNNCMSVTLLCEAGHRISFIPQRKCFAKDCDWLGKTACFCHQGKKDPEWPEIFENYIRRIQ